MKEIKKEGKIVKILKSSNFATKKGKKELKRKLTRNYNVIYC